MTVSSLIEKIARRSHQRNVEKAASFLELVRAVHSGKEDVAPDDAAAILEAAGKTTEELQQAVALLERRTKWAAQIARTEESEKRLSEVEEQRDAQNEKWKAAQAKHQEVFDRILVEEHRIKKELEQARLAATQLRETPLDESLAERREVVARRRKDVGPRLANVEKLILQHSRRREGASKIQDDTRMDVARRRVEKTQKVTDSLAELRGIIKDADEQLARLEPQRDELQKELAEIEAEEAKVRELELTP